MELGKSPIQQAKAVNLSYEKGTASRLIPPLLFIFFISYLVLGLQLVRDYGLTWDEEYERLHGLVVLDYFNDLSGGRLLDQNLSNYELDSYFNRHYGTAFQTVAIGLEFLFSLDDPREWYLLRHYMTFLVWFFALVFFFRLLQIRYKNLAFSLIGVIFMILSPRIFADAFYNSKDIIFLAFYIIGTYTLVKYLQRTNLINAFYLALATALLINTRILGVIFPVISLLSICLKSYYRHKSQILTKNDILPTIYFMFFLLAFTILLWPYLWENPFVRLFESFRAMGHFPWDDPVLYWGKFITATELPWHYIPSWILITTPVLYIALFLAGTGFSIYRMLRVRWKEENIFHFLELALFFLPLLAVIILRSTLYDGWRQMFFLYGPFMMLVMNGFYELLKGCKGLNPQRVSRIARSLLFIVVLWSIGATTFFMVKYHPHQNVYFNVIAGRETTKNFEADYWGLSYRQALQYLLKYDKRDSIPVFSINSPGRLNAQILAPDQRKRLIFVEPDKADYWLSNYRFPVEHGRYFRQEPPYDNVLWEKKVKGNAIVGIYLID
jgi:hypothetical protein